MTVRHAMLAMALGTCFLLTSAHTATADEMTASVSGEVTLKGKLLTSGRIIFYLDDDQFVGGKIRDGAFKVTRVPVGTWRVEVEGEGMPARVNLEGDVKSGKNRFDIDLKGR